MAPAIPCSFGSVTLSTKTPCCLRKEAPLAKCSARQKFLRTPISYGRYPWFQPVSLTLLQKYNIYCRSKHALRLQPTAAIGADIVTEEQVTTDSAEQSTNVSQGSATVDDASTSSSAAAPVQSKRSRPSRKSEMPPVKDEDLVMGATFTGKVRSIQPFGAFIDFGAFTDGLVHVSKLSDGFVKDVATVVSVGQEVKVRIVEVNNETGRISLSMRENDDVGKSPPSKETYRYAENEKPRNTRRNAPRSNQKRDDTQKGTKFVKGQVLEGTVKNLGRSGAFISLPDGEEGFLPMSEESEGFGNILGNSSLQVGQEVSIRVLRISRGKLTLTMKKEEDIEAINKQLNQGVVHTATNPFVLAFRQSKEIAAFLDEQEKVRESANALISKMVVEEIVEVEKNELEAPEPEPAEPIVEAAIIEPITGEDLTSDATLSETDTIPAEASTSSGLNEADAVEDGSDTSSTSLSSESSVPKALVTADFLSEGDNVEGSAVADAGIENISETDAEKEDNIVVDDKTENAVAVDATTGSDIVNETNIETSRSEQVVEPSLHPEVVVAEETGAGQPNGALTSADDVSPADEPLILSSESVETALLVSNEQSNSTSEGDSTKDAVAITPALVKKLREETGAGMMDCKNALTATEGSIAKAQELLRKKGLASADKRAGKATAEGRIGSYIHDNRIGVLIEVNCETDFVSRGSIFKELVEDLAMQVAACPQVQYLVPEDVPEELVNKEREIEMQKEDLQSKPEQLRLRIVEGRIIKRLQELALLEQPYIKNDKVVVKDWVKQAIAAIGENIRVKRFVRYNLGEGLEKRNENFAAEVAAQTVVKVPQSSAPEDKPAEDSQPKEMAPTVVVSAALVKQLREETGAGMMDCKKALAESGGDLEKAQEYLRKKGISSAAKKSSRVTADGRIASYIHDSRIGALIEVNSETDFVARNDRFKELVCDLAMQVVACPQVQFVSVEDVPESVILKEKEIEMQREDLQSKPEQIREKIVEGRISKRLAELALLEQPFIKDDKLLVKDLVSQTVAALGENIKVRRFARFTLGE